MVSHVCNICPKAQRGVSLTGAALVTVARELCGFRDRRLDFLVPSCYIVVVMLKKGFCLILESSTTQVQTWLFPWVWHLEFQTHLVVVV